MERSALVGASSLLLLCLAHPSHAVADAGAPSDTSEDAGQAQDDAGDVAQDTERLPPLALQIDRSRVQLDAHRLELSMSRPAKKARVRVLDVQGNVLAENEVAFRGEPAGTPLTVTWTPSSDAPVARVEVWGYDTSGYWAGVAIIPWSVRIPHDEVLFDTGKANIRTEQEPKLEASFATITKALDKHKSLGPIRLFIAGHTDTVGSEASNLTLSRNRAKAIAAWFKTRGLSIPIAYEGFGESVPAVKTGDGVDEPRNRRVDYILAIEPPRIRKGEPAAWKAIGQP
ncbi:MAG: OmpA family protein [Myxococcota bacterium]